jgi:ribose 5-phosphate isomerase B
MPLEMKKRIKIMKISLGSDHAGYSLKEYVKQYLLSKGYEVIDFGTDSEKSVDYPDYIIPAAECVAESRSDYGIVFGKSGNGEAIAANKVKGIRCALCWNVTGARLAKEHNNANMISLGAEMVENKKAAEIIESWLNSSFMEGRHLKRIQKIHEYEKSH